MPPVRVMAVQAVDVVKYRHEDIHLRATAESHRPAEAIVPGEIDPGGGCLGAGGG